LKRSGFRDVRRVSEADLLARFPEFPFRGDDLHSLYLRAVIGLSDIALGGCAVVPDQARDALSGVEGWQHPPCTSRFPA
jgi:hypothetical protein